MHKPYVPFFPTGDECDPATHYGLLREAEPTRAAPVIFRKFEESGKVSFSAIQWARLTLLGQDADDPEAWPAIEEASAQTAKLYPLAFREFERRVGWEFGPIVIHLLSLLRMTDPQMAALCQRVVNQTHTECSHNYLRDKFRTAAEMVRIIRQGGRQLAQGVHELTETEPEIRSGLDGTSRTDAKAARKLPSA